MGGSDEDSADFPERSVVPSQGSRRKGYPPGRGGVSGGLPERQNQPTMLLVQVEGGCHSSITQQGFLRHDCAPDLGKALGVPR